MNGECLIFFQQIMQLYLYNFVTYQPDSTNIYIYISKFGDVELGVLDSFCCMDSMGFLSPSRSVPRLRPLEPIISEKRPPLLQAPRSEQLAKHGDEDEEWGKKQQRYYENMNK